MLWIFPMKRYDAMRVKNIRDEKIERRKYDIGPMKREKVIIRDYAFFSVVASPPSPPPPHLDHTPTSCYVVGSTYAKQREERLRELMELDGENSNGRKKRGLKTG